MRKITILFDTSSSSCKLNETEKRRNTSFLWIEMVCKYAEEIKRYTKRDNPRFQAIK